jgi:hypothetical protein
VLDKMVTMREELRASGPHLARASSWPPTCRPGAAAHKKSRWNPAAFLWDQAELLQLDFLVFHMLASLGIKLHDQHFLGHGFLVFGGGVEVAGTRSGFQLDLFASAFACHGVSP